MEDLRHEKQEIMKLLMLNSKSKLIGETNISKGTVNASLITPRELFIEALQKNAVFVIIYIIIQVVSRHQAEKTGSLQGAFRMREL